MRIAATGTRSSTASTPGFARVLSSVAAVATVGVFPVFLVGGLGVQLRDEIGLGAASLGIATAAFFGVAALASRGMGWVVERIGSSFAMRLAAVASSVCLAGLAVAENPAWLIAVLCVAGVATALAQPASNLLITQGVPLHRRGMGFGVKQSAIPAATMLAGLAVPAVALTIGWRWTFVFAALVGVVAASTVPGVPKVEKQTHPIGRSAAAPAPRGALLLIAAAGGLASGAANALGAFLTITAVQVGFSPWAAGLVLSVGSATGLTIRLIAGAVADRRNPNLLRVMTVMLFAGAGGFGLLAVPSPMPFLLGVTIGFGAGWAWPGLLNFAVSKIAPDRVASATSFTQTGVYLGACGGPLLFGFLVEHWGVGSAWMGAAIAAVLAGGLLLFVRK